MHADETSSRYSRQMLFKPIGPDGQRKLAERAVLIVGMGALGTVLANHMVRAGVGTVRFVDRDYVEASNLQRQMLYDEEDAAQSIPKAVAARRRLAKINSGVKLEEIVADVTPDNVDQLLEGIDLVLDGTDNFQTRYLMNDACFKHGIPFVYGGAVASRGMSAIFVPRETACLRCLIQPAEGTGETCDTIGVIAPIVDIVASYQAVEALKYLVGDTAARRKSLVTLDVWHNHYYEMKLPPSRPDCPVCSGSHYPALERNGPLDDFTSLCGRETIQIRARASFDLAYWREKLEAVATVQANPFLLKAALPEGERLVLFPDGRALIQGTEDPVRAKTLYARYIGL
ncbi:thiazole biosynthesis adenylyltransferase ThiF [Paenibacillus mesophilus]|uniref:ThiF family adenylyltransferase n=1 Tax=Paenibacillus mesophilus TaxID=2582849 RepID=UPI00110D4433|nr:ThiF family adenylyltransferase [Paenibacillus mesophilus]TMV51453.1 thiazole biosynthesis adenylyltransferase ThiF [Paenibacillus mesophilus]